MTNAALRGKSDAGNPLVKKCLLMLLACFAGASIAYATEYFASPDATDDETKTCLTEESAGTITNALARATADDDIVTLLKGTTGVYDMTKFTPKAENTKVVNVKKPSYYQGAKRITVRSKSANPQDAVLQGGGTSIDGRCFAFAAGATLSGLTLTNFYTSGQAAAVYSTEKSLFITNCVVTCNRSADVRGALYNLKATGCTLTGNHSALYAGVGESIDLVKCTVVSNGCTGNVWSGAGCILRNSTVRDSAIGSAYFEKYTSVGYCSGSTFSNCTFSSGSVAGKSETAMLYQSTAYDCAFVDNVRKNNNGGLVKNSTLYRCAFTNNFNSGAYGGCVVDSTCYDCQFVSNRNSNTTHYYGGGAGYGGSYYSCSFYGNSCSNNNARGGALASPLMASNCVFVGNFCNGFGGAIAQSDSSASSAKARNYRVYDSFFTNNFVWTGSAGAVYGVSISNCVVYGSEVKATGGCGGAGYLVHAMDSRFEKNVMNNYHYGLDGGGALMGGSAVNCVFVGNEDKGTAGGAACVNVAMTNCLVYGNITTDTSAGDYGGSVVYAGVPCVNCTIVSNKTLSTCGACVGTFINCIIVDNYPCDVWSRKTKKYELQTILTNCVYETAHATRLPDEATGCRQAASAAAVKFASRDIDDTDAYRLTRRSPARDLGLDVGLTANDRDLDGLPRVYGKAIDAGCYECNIPAPGLLLLCR